MTFLSNIHCVPDYIHSAAPLEMRSAGRDTGSSKRRKLQTDSARVESPLSHDDASPTAPLHPLRVKPLGNLYESSAPNIKIRAGSFAKLPDELLLHFLDWCAAPELLSLGATCKALHAFSSVDELWKTLVIEYVIHVHTLMMNINVFLSSYT